LISQSRGLGDVYKRQPNQCAMEVAKETGNPIEECWCASIVFTPETLAKIPPQALNKACICKKCAAVD
jgi:hypothetical protein